MNRKRQIAQGNKERKRLERSVGSSGVGPGAVVVVRNDPGDISHAHGTMGVVYHCSRTTGGLKNCTQWGVITQGQSHIDYWIPRSRYVVKLKPDEDAGIDHELQTLKNEVIDDKFDEGSQQRITLQEYYCCLIGKPKEKLSVKEWSVLQPLQVLEQDSMH